MTVPRNLIVGATEARREAILAKGRELSAAAADEVIEAAFNHSNNMTQLHLTVGAINKRYEREMRQFAKEQE